MGTATKVLSTGELGPGQGRTVDVNGQSVAVFNVGGQFFAIHNTCLHRGGPLGEGTLEGNVVTCPWHGWEYDVATGQCVTNPNAKLSCFKVAVQGTDLLVET